MKILLDENGQPNVFMKGSTHCKYTRAAFRSASYSRVFCSSLGTGISGKKYYLISCFSVPCYLRRTTCRLLKFLPSMLSVKVQLMFILFTLQNLFS